MPRRWCGAHPSGRCGCFLRLPSKLNVVAEDLSNPIPACVRNGMLDQKDRPPGGDRADIDGAPDDFLFDREESAATGTMLGRWRAGVSAPPGSGYGPPLWRRI